MEVFVAAERKAIQSLRLRSGLLQSGRVYGAAEVARLKAVPDDVW
jgi:hypothetical protein